jgi:hypothetical protein
MKKQFLFLLATVFVLGFFSSCNDDEEPDEHVKNLKLTVTSVDGNQATFTATAENASTYAWDFGNGDKGSGATVTATYKFPGDYWVKCTASGKIDKVTDSIKVTLEEGDPSIVNPVTELLASHPWKWAGNGTQPNDFGYWSCGPKSHVYTNTDSAHFDYFDKFDDSWWKLGEYDAAVGDEMLDDVYTFTLDKTMKFENDYDSTGMMWNWAWAIYNFNAETDIWEDLPLAQGGGVGSWNIEVIDQPVDTLPKTIVNGNPVDKLYIVTVKGGVYLGVGSVGPEPKYQICRIDSDTLWVRYDNTYPQDLPIKDTWAAEGVVTGEGEWGYFYLVKAE